MQDVNLQPHLIGELLELRPLRLEDREGLFLAASDPKVWEQHPSSDRYKAEVFKDFFQEGLDSKGAFVVIDRKTQSIIGSTRYSGHNPEKREIEIGWTFLSRAYWGGEYNGEMKRLMLNHAFQFVDTVVFMIGPNNHRSRRAVEKIGGAVAGQLQRKNSHGAVLDFVVYEIKKPNISALQASQPSR